MSIFWVRIKKCFERPILSLISLMVQLASTAYITTAQLLPLNYCAHCISLVRGVALFCSDHLHYMYTIQYRYRYAIIGFTPESCWA